MSTEVAVAMWTPRSVKRVTVRDPSTSETKHLERGALDHSAELVAANATGSAVG
jgi:hypothetical protein